MRILVIIAIALTISGCGRRGPLEAPRPMTAPGPQENVVTRQAPPPGAQILLDPASPGAQEPAEARPVAAPERPFFLDFLL